MKRFESEDFSRSGVIASCFLLGCYSTVSQVLLFREELIILAGNEMALALLLTGWLIGIWIGALISGRWCSRKWIYLGLSSSLMGMPSLFAASVTAVRLSPQILSLPVEDYPSPLLMILISLGSVVPMGLWIGLVFPILAIAMNESRRLTAENSESKHAAVIGSVFTWESLGSVCAGIVLVYWIIPRWDAYTIAFGMMGLSLLLMCCNRKRTLFPWGYLSGLLFILFCMILSIPQWIDSWSAARRWQSRHPGYQQKRILETPYQRLELGVREDQYTLFGSGSPLFSFPNEYENAQGAHFALSQRPDPNSILLIGSGGFDWIHHFLEHKPNTLIWVETDPGILEMISDSRISFSSNTKMETINSDPRRYLSTLDTQVKFSLIAVHQPDPINGLLNRYYTREFFHLARLHLEKQGILVFSITGTPNYEFGDVGVLGGTLYWTLHDEFPQVLVVPGMEWWFFASPGKSLSANPTIVTEQYRRHDPKCTFFSAAHLTLYYEESHIVQLQSALATFSHYPRNSDFRPLCYLYTLMVWSKQYGFLKNLPLENIPLQDYTILPVGLLMGGFLFTLCWGVIRVGVRNPQTSVPLITLATTGLSAMGAQLAVLLFFQCRVGCLYQQIGLFFGVFMLGLALGSAVGSRWASQSKTPALIQLKRIDLGFTILLGVTPLIFILGTLLIETIFGIEILLLGWMGILAGSAGMLFPIVAKTLEGTERGIAWISGWTDAVDNLGGALGAMVTGVLLIPWMGLNSTFLILTFMKLLNQSVLQIHWAKSLRIKNQF